MAVKSQQGSPRVMPQRAEDELKLEDGADPGEAPGSDVEPGIANDSGTIPGRKVDHSDPHDIPPPGMKRRY